MFHTFPEYWSSMTGSDHSRRFKRELGMTALPQ
jgi:hypothetical protein